MEWNAYLGQNNRLQFFILYFGSYQPQMPDINSRSGRGGKRNKKRSDIYERRRSLYIYSNIYIHTIDLSNDYLCSLAMENKSCFEPLGLPF